jgi:glycosyltransferase involved in cell wall biosynthesis
MKISVVICSYNYAHFLKDALRSASAQTLQDFELLIVDDGSTDESQRVVENFPFQFLNRIYLRKEHSGLPDTRNFGIKAASGSHIAFLDADDLWSPLYLAKMRETFESNPDVQLVCSDGYRVRDNGEVYGFLFPPNLPRLSGRIHNPEQLFQFFPYVLPSALTFRKSLFEQIGPFDQQYPLGSDDWDWIIRAARSGAFCVQLDEKLVLYRTHDANLTKNIAGSFHEWIQLYKDLFAKQTDEETEKLARSFTRKHFPVLLSQYSAKQNRELLDEAIEVHRNDLTLQSLRALTYVGLCSVARFGRTVKGAHRRSSKSTRRFDLQQPPEKLFA